MPDHRQHRGPHPEDAGLFGPPDRVHTLRCAAGDLAWLLGRQYAPSAALTLVGNHYQLHARQRQALARAVAAPAVARARRQRQVAVTALAGTGVSVDGFNQLITMEVALSGGLLLRGHDGALRDLASVHGTYRTIRETPTALEALGTVLAPLHLHAVHIFLDAPVSNAGRLASRMRTLAATHAWPWHVLLVPSADAVLQQTDAIVATSESGILDAPVRWCDLAAAVVAQQVPEAWCLALDVPPPQVEGRRASRSLPWRSWARDGPGVRQARARLSRWWSCGQDTPVRRLAGSGVSTAPGGGATHDTPRGDS